MISALVSIYFGISWLRHTIKIKCIKFQAIDPELCLTFKIVSPSHFVNHFSRKIFLMLDSINWPNSTSWSNCQYVYCNCLFSSLHGITLWNFPWLFYHAVFLNNNKIRTKILIYLKRTDFWRWNKKHFSSFLKGLQLPEIVSDLRFGFYIVPWRKNWTSQNFDFPSFKNYYNRYHWIFKLPLQLKDQ